MAETITRAAMQECVKCRLPKPAREFRTNPNCKKQQGMRSCVACRNNRTRLRHIAYPLVKLYHGAKANARAKGQSFTIRQSDIAIPSVCPVLGIPIAVSEGRMGNNSPSIDRRDSTLGYIPGNVAVISWRANRIKSDATLDELKKIVAWLEATP